MSKSAKELAFLREFSIENDWTQRFTDYFDKNFKFGEGEKKVFYVNAGAGNHVLALREKLDDKIEIYAVSETEDLRNIAQAKADAVRAEVSFGTNFPDEKAEIVIADASLVRPDELDNFLSEIIEASAKQVAFFLPTKGSFGEVFSFLWEALLEADLAEKGAHVERLISEIPAVEEIKELSENLGLKTIESSTESEIFEFKDGAEFVASPLVAEFLFPVWLDFLDDEEVEKVKERLAALVDAEDGTLSFRFSVKNTLFSGEVA